MADTTKLPLKYLQPAQYESWLRKVDDPEWVNHRYRDAKDNAMASAIRELRDARAQSTASEPPAKRVLTVEASVEVKCDWRGHSLYNHQWHDTVDGYQRCANCKLVREKPLPAEQQPIDVTLDHLLLRLWDKAVGTERYVKAEWSAVQTKIVQKERQLSYALSEVDRLKKLINTPQTEDFFEAVKLEAAHQQERWGTKDDAGKTDANWFWLIGYLAGKILRPDNTQEKRLHHIITSGAAILNWHRYATGQITDMRPGIEEPK